MLFKLLVGSVLLGIIPRVADALPISISTTSGTMLGEVKEFVYDNGYTVSELDWPLLPAFYVGAKIDIGAKSGFLSSVELQLGIPSNAGSMTDSDFLNGDGVKTDFSQSDGDLQSSILLTAQAGWGLPFDIPGGGTATFEPYLSFEFLQIQWTAQNGYLQYPPETSPPYTPWSPSTPQTPIYGTAIIYTQDYLIPAMGIKGSFPLTGSLKMTASFAFSPFLWCFDKDSHLFRQLDFYDTMSGGLFIEPRLSATYALSSKLAVTLDVLYRHMEQLVGNSYAVGTGASGYTPVSELAPGEQTATTSNGGGVSFDAVNITLSFDVGLQ